MNHRFEHRTEPLLTTQAFVRRVIISFSFGMGIVILSLAVDMAGYHFFERLSWLDSFANVSMLLSGGPLEQPQTNMGKIFAGVYALYSGLAVILIVGIITFAPIVHRFLHKFHLESEG